MKPMATMNVIPFIDVMLVLLAIVLTTATFVAQGKIPVTLPGATAAEPLRTLPSVEITVSADGVLFLEQALVSHDTLSRRLADYPRGTRFVLRVDEHAAFRHFVSVIDLLKTLGLHDVSIVTRQQHR